jgi:hypothetical protein
MRDYASGIRIEARRSQPVKPQRVMELARADHVPGKLHRTTEHSYLRAASAVMFFFILTP